MRIENDLLDEAQNRVAEIAEKKRKRLLEPDTIVLHYTAGPSAGSAINTFLDPDVQACAHLVVDRDGSIAQLVPFNRQTWHAGASEHLDRKGLNVCSIGIEVVNAGRLKKVGVKYTSWFSKEYEEEEIFLGIHRNEDVPSYWHRYTQQQIETVSELCRVLRKYYQIRYILGHEEISPGRKIDPGPAFPLDKIRNQVLNLHPRDEDTEPDPGLQGGTGRVSASKLNIRAEADKTADKVAKALPRGKKVIILGQKNDWYRVKVEVEGWVSAAHVKTD